MKEKVARMFSIEKQVWLDFLILTKENGQTMSYVINELLKMYIEKNGKK